MLNNLKKIFEDIFKGKGGESKQQDKDSKTTIGESGKKPKVINSNLLTNLAIVFLVGVLLLIVGSMFTKDNSPKGSDSGTANVVAIGGDEIQKNTDTTSSAVDKAYKEKMQEELISLLGKIEGVGKVYSMIYFESGQEQIPVFNEETSTSVTSEKDNGGGQREITQENGGSTVVMENKENQQQPFITKTYNPTITGICVVAEGAGDSVTELRIRQAVIKLFGLSDDKVQVYPMNKKQTIIISSLVVLILFAGYLATQVNGPLYVSDTKGNDGTTISASTNANYFTEARLQRDNNATKTLQTLKALLDDENTPQDQKAEAADEYKNLALQSDKEVKIELALKAQGFEEALCTLDKEKATVVVRHEGELSDQQVRQIKDVVMSKADIKDIEIKVAE